MAAGELFGVNDETARFIGHIPSTVDSVFQPPTVIDTYTADDGGFDLEPDFSITDFELTGEQLTTFFEDWYFRLHVLPQRFDLANVVSDQNRQILIWNAFFDDKVISSAEYPTGVGVDVIDDQGVPYTMRPLEDVFYAVVVSSEGPPTIDTAIEWIIGGDLYTVPVTGRRIVVWPFGPNWRQPMVESLDWLTDVFTSFNGNEQRRELRSKPRRMFEYTAWVKKADAAIMRNLLWGWQTRNFALPLWNDRTYLTAAAAAGTDLLSLDTSNRGFYKGGLLVLFNDALDYEVVEITTITSSSITLAKTLERSWPEQAQVYPINICRMPTNVSGRLLTDGVHETMVSFNADPLQTDPAIPVIAATTTHGPYEVVLRKPNWAQPVSFDSEYEYLPVDFQVGGTLAEQKREWPMIVRRFQWQLKSRAEVTQFRGLLGRLKGRLKPVYLPTWFDDFELYEPITASAVAIPVKNNEFLKMVGQDPALNTLMILVHGQEPIIRTISTVGSDPGGYTVLGLNAAVGFDLNSTTLQRLSLVHLCRQATDRVTINWLTDSVATVEANFALVKA